MKRARRRSQPGNGDMNVSGLGSNPGPDSDSMDVDSECGGANKQFVVQSNKRPRISNPDTQKCLPKAPIVDLPPEIFAEICKYLRPEDLLSLARCKPFRGYLMKKAHQSTWWEAMKHVKNLPPCPRGFSEPQYLALLFSNFCTVCGSTKQSQMQVDVLLLVRLCKNCQKECLAYLTNTCDVPVDIRGFLHRSNVFGKWKGGQPPDARVLKTDVYSIIEALDEAEQSGDGDALIELKEKMREAVLERKMRSDIITRALELYENELRLEIKDVQVKRRLEIERRCIDDLGMEKDDLQFGWISLKRKKYYQLLDKPWPLYNYEWEDIRPELKRLLSANRGERLAGKRGGPRRNQPSCNGTLGPLDQPLTLEVDPILDNIYHLEGIELVV